MREVKQRITKGSNVVNVHAPLLVGPPGRKVEVASHLVDLTGEEGGRHGYRASGLGLLQVRLFYPLI